MVEEQLDTEAGEEPLDAPEIWPENERAVRIFLHCGDSWDIVAGLAGAYYQGIKVEAVRAVMLISRVPLAEQLELLADVRAMAAGAKEVLNARKEDE